MSPRGPQKVWITRAQPGADATAQRVRALGHEPLIAPLLTVRPIADVAVDLAGVGALAFTSANGVRAFAEASPFRDLQVFSVGSATARAARAAGFRRVLSADGDVNILAQGIVSRAKEIEGEVLHLGAAELAGDLVGALAARNVPARHLALYETVSAQLDRAVVARLAEMDAVLLHSPKAATLLARRLRSTPLPNLRALCLSKAVAAPLAKSALAETAFAPLPLEAALLNLIDR